MSDSPKTAIIGSGLIGCAWAVAFARGGCRVALYDQNPNAAEHAHQTLARITDDLAAADMLDGQSASEILGLVSRAGSLDDALSGAVHV